jgi:tetratricopeptide (TPR) repeat protein
LLNNIGWTLHDAGRFDEALDQFERGLAFRRAQPASPGNDNATRIAKWAVARAKRSLGRIDEALAEQEALLAEHAVAGSNDAYVHEELGELLLLLNRADEARPHFAKAHELLSKDEWFAKNEGERLERMRRMGEGGE